jgi:hypothetical protein
VSLLSRAEVLQSDEWSLLESAVVIVGSLTRVHVENVEDYVPPTQSSNVMTSRDAARQWLRSLWLAPLYVVSFLVLSLLSLCVFSVCSNSIVYLFSLSLLSLLPFCFQ